MANLVSGSALFHQSDDVNLLLGTQPSGWFRGVDPSNFGFFQYQYDFKNFFHPYVGALIKQLNATTFQQMLDPGFLDGLDAQYTSTDYTQTPNDLTMTVTIEPKKIDTSIGGPYANYNWELLYHLPVAVAVHLSNNQRFAEAQKWFHLVFDPTNTDTSVSGQPVFWRSFVFNGTSPAQSIQTLLQTLDSTDPAYAATKAQVVSAYTAMLANPFDPYAVARNRQSAFQWYVVMKYLDNLIAWGDNLFLQDTIETINEATLCYVLAANLLGERPQSMPQPGTKSAKNFRQLQQAGLDAMSNALIDLEAQFPFNLTPPPSQGGSGADQSGALFGIGRALYFCVPQNPNLVAYWDTVADRLFKIRNSENIQGVVQQLPLFDPPLNPGMLVKAAAAGVDISSVVAGLNQPLGPMRAPYLIEKALELAVEVRSLGAALLAAIEKGENEQLALMRQTHEVALQTLLQNVRFLQWKQTQEATNALMKTRTGVWERYKNYLRLLGATPDATLAPPTLNPDRTEITEATFDDVYAKLIGEFDLAVPLQTQGPLTLDQGSSPSASSGASGTGLLFLITNEGTELNTLLPAARDARDEANRKIASASQLNLIPSIDVDLHYWGLGVHSKVFGGDLLADLAKISSEQEQITAGYNTDQAGIASRTAGYQRRSDEWMHQVNLAARDLMAIGRQTIASLIAEQVAYHDYTNTKTQIQQAQDVRSFLQDKFTNQQFYSWVQGETSGLYYQYYRFACDIARRAEQTMKRELMRPELDDTQFIQFNYWDSGHQGLLSGEALHFDLKRLEMAYHDNNTRELEMTRHVSLRQLDPQALVAMRLTGTCTVSIPEWLYDIGCPGHYMRRIKTVSLSIPSVVGPYASINCTLSLQASSLRVSPLLANGVYARDPTQDDIRFVDYFGATDVIVTSGASNDSGLFETNLHDERFLPFEGAGAISTWTLALPSALPAFDYSTISDVIIHVRYTAREAGNPLGSQAINELLSVFKDEMRSPQTLLLCLRYDFPTEWAAFVNGGGAQPFQATIDSSFLPYYVQTMKKAAFFGDVRLYGQNASGAASTSSVPSASAVKGTPLDPAGATLTLLGNSAIAPVLTNSVYVLLGYTCAN